MRAPTLAAASIAALALAVAGGPAAAQDAEAVVEAEPPALVEGPDTVVYVFPTSPATFVPIVGLPSFLVMPGAPLPEIATQVVYTMPMPALPAAPAVTVPGDLDCAQFAGTVLAPAPDPYNLDADGDGIGCEPEDR